MSRGRTCIALLFFLGTTIADPVDAFDDRDTHRRLTRFAVTESMIDLTLKTELGRSGGVLTQLPSAAGAQRIRDIVELASRAEDEPACRAGHHFHNPLKLFASAGVTDRPSVINTYCAERGFGTLSSVIWGTRFISLLDRSSSTGNPFDWDAARQAYLEALTLDTSTGRDAALARTFEALGHIVHLVQDLAVPGHVRNDFRSHLHLFPKLAPFDRWFENAFERFVRLRRDLVDDAAPTDVTFPGARITRFWDIDQYDGTNPSADLVQGLAEYTNANFASPSTVFTEDLPSADRYAFPYPRQSSTNIADLFPHRVIPRFVTGEDGVVDTGLYLTKVRDGEVIDRFLRVGYLMPYLMDSVPPGGPHRLALQFDEAVHEDYARKLLPRALGYSKATLDYFFRGRLDVDLVSDPNDPSLLRIKGTNASPDALVGGTLTLYTDTAEGVRSPGAAAGSTAIGNVAAGDPVQSAAFQVPPGAERFVAVYQGTLGAETPDPSQNLPGAVIGKVLGGTRVEHLFAQGGLWKIRTPDGIFPLPITTQAVPLLVWGDRDNTLVGISPFSRFGGQNTFFAWEIRRAVGDPRVPVTETGQVDVQPLSDKTKVFPFGLDLGTTVKLSQTLKYRKYLPAYHHMEVQDENGTLLSETFEFVNERVIDVSGTVQRDYPLELELDRMDNFQAIGARWSLRAVNMTADGRILATVDVTMTRTGEVFPVPRKRYVLPCTTWPCPIEEQTPGSLSVTFPFLATMTAIVDVTNGRLEAWTAPPIVTLTHTTVTTQVGDGSAGGGTVAEARQISRPNEAPAYAIFPPSQQLGNFSLVSCDHLPETSVIRIGTIDDYVFGTEAATLASFTPELQALNFSSISAQRTSTVRRCVSNFEPRPGQFPAIAFTVVTTEPQVFHGLPTLIRRTRSSPERVLVVYTQSGGFTGGSKSRVVAWNPATPGADLRYDGDPLNVTGWSRQLAVGFSAGTLFHAIPLEGTAATTSLVVPQDTADDFLALEPGFVFGKTDLKFYRIKPSLEPTALPRTLAPGGPTTGDFHAFTLK